MNNTAFEAGRNAFLIGQVGNPHQINTNNYREWERGWNKEYFENLEKVKQDESTRAGG